MIARCKRSPLATAESQSSSIVLAYVKWYDRVIGRLRLGVAEAAVLRLCAFAYSASRLTEVRHLALHRLLQRIGVHNLRSRKSIEYTPQRSVAASKANAERVASRADTRQNEQS